MKNQRRGEVKGGKEEGAEADDDEDGMKRRGRASQSLELGLERSGGGRGGFSRGGGRSLLFITQEKLMLRLVAAGDGAAAPPSAFWKRLLKRGVVRTGA